MELNDGFTFDILNEHLDAYILYVMNIIKINNKCNINNKKIRAPNFPEAISENIVKFAYKLKYDICPNWCTSSGDLEIYDTTNKHNIKIEVKGFSSNGPSSFGPTEQWNILYFIDCSNFINKKFKIYEINLSNTNPDFYNIKVNKNTTYKNHCDQGKRPRIIFKDLQKQLVDKCKIIFDGSLDSLK
jgi:hypothetical protein